MKVAMIQVVYANYASSETTYEADKEMRNKFHIYFRIIQVHPLDLQVLVTNLIFRGRYCNNL